MTKSTITRERLEQLANFKGAPVTRQEEQELARMALAAMDSEPVAYIYRDNLHSDARFSLESKIGNWSPEDINEYEISETPLYRHAQPAPVVPEEIPKGLAGQIVSLLAHNIGDKFLAQKIWNACRAAMLNGGES